MKVRWTERSVRLRITPEELGKLQNDEEISVAFSVAPNSSWSVRVAVAPSTSLQMQDGTLLFSLARTDIEKLCEPQREGVYFSQGEARYFIEKDFPCAHPRAGEAQEEATSTFAPPPDFEQHKNT